MNEENGRIISKCIFETKAFDQYKSISRLEQVQDLNFCLGIETKVQIWFVLQLLYKLSKGRQTSPKGFSASKCDVGNWILSNCLRNCQEIFQNFQEIFENFWGGFFWKDFLGGFFLEEFFVYIGIDLLVKILSQCRSKAGGQILTLRSATQAHRT